MNTVLTLIVGLVFGSFINVLISRLKIEKNGNNQIDLTGGSYCDSCKKGLAWYEMVPVVSYIFLKGRCRHCDERIPLYVPLVELACGILALMISIYFGITVGSVILFLISLLMVAVFVYDLRHQLIPNLYVWVLLVLAVVYNFYLYSIGFFNLSSILLSVLVGSGFFLLFYLVSKGKWMGLGDVKLMVIIGLVLGWPLVLVQLYTSFIIGGIIGLMIIAISKKGMKSKIAFGPFLVVGFFVALFHGEAILLLVNNYLYL